MSDGGQIALFVLGQLTTIAGGVIWVRCPRAPLLVRWGVPMVGWPLFLCTLLIMRAPNLSWPILAAAPLIGIFGVFLTRYIAEVTEQQHRQRVTELLSREDIVEIARNCPRALRLAQQHPDLLSAEARRELIGE